MLRKYLIVLFFMVFVGAGHAFAQAPETECPPECVTDSLEIVTYYPSPYGLYEELRGDKIIVGDTQGSLIGSTEATLPPSGTITFAPLSGDPSVNRYEGSLYYQGAIGGTKGKFRFYDGSDWQDLGGSGGGYWKPSDIDSANIYYDAGNVGIGVSANEAIGAKLQVKADTAKGLVVKSAIANTVKIGDTYTFDFVNAQQTFTVPLGVSKIKVTAYGASAGAKGGMAEGIISVTPGEILYLFVGGSNGWNGGGSGGYKSGNYVSNGGNGGGASDVRRGGNNSSNRVIVAGGAGGNSGADMWGTTVSQGGIGGGVSGDRGVNSVTVANGGGGGSNVAGGTAGGNGSVGDSASLGYGGIGGNAYSTNCSGDCAANWIGSGGGGGGGGYHGGGGGGGFTSSEKYTSCQGGGGGGGSSLIPSGGTTQAGVWSGNGRIIIMASEVSSYPNISEWQDGSGNVLSAININGNFGIGTATPSAALDIASGKTTLADAWSTRSSLRFKENLYPIDNALNKIASLQGVYFDYKDSHKHSLGLVAEDVGKVFPELVTYETNGQDAISLDYDKLGAVTVEAIKEQQKEIKELKALLKETARSQQKEIEFLKAEKKQEVAYP